MLAYICVEERGEADRLLLDGDVPAAILARARADAERMEFTQKSGAAAVGLAAAPGESQPAQSGSGDSPETGLTLVLRWRPES